MADELGAFLADNPDIARVEAFVCDVNGIARGKWLPRDKALEAAASGLPLPRSIFALDIWGRDVPEAGLAFGTGDPDGMCRPVPGSVARLPWAARPTAQVMLTMEGADGAPFFGDPRAMLANVAARFGARGWTPVVATELEFYILDGDPAAQVDGTAQVLSIEALRARADVLDAIEDAAQALAIPTETMLRENGPGQYEINLRHVADPLAAADHAIMLKRIVRAVAQAHGLGATFMAKPFGRQAGSGMHVHVSLRDAAGAALLAGADGAPSAMLRHAVGGLIAAMPEAMLLFAPHANSYRRFRRGSHAPMSAGWGKDDRSAAIRVITGSPAATRIEHRVAGADANPYLVVAAILAGMLDGIERATDPGPAQSPADEGLTGAPLPQEWGVAIDTFAASPLMAAAFGTSARDMIAACKRQDRDEMLARVSDVELSTCLTSL